MAKKTLGKYEIIDRLGRGGMAEVYRAYHAQLDRYVAIKLLHPFLADDSEFKERFGTEAKNIARLRHPHIVQVFDFDFDSSGESYYMVMELIEGQTLKDILFDLASTGQKLEQSRALEITKEAASALAYAHKIHMVHRDVKPANLMVEPDGRVVLTDFGIAKIVTGAQFTASGGMIGTPAYMSPEQGMGESGDERSDLYSLGVILYQMVTGSLPYDAETPLAVILKHLNEPLPPPRTVNPDIPEWLERVIIKTLAKNPDDRFANADQLIKALEEGEKANIVMPEDPDMPTTPIIMSTPPPRYGDTSPHPLSMSQPIAPANQSANLLSLVTAAAVVVGVILMIAIVLGQGGSGPLAGVFATDVPEIAEEPTPTPTNTLTPTHTPTETPTETPSPTPTSTATDTPSPTLTPTYTPSPTLTPTYTPSPTETITPSPTINLTATAREEEVIAGATSTAEAQAAFFATQRAITPTLDIERVLNACDLEFSVTRPTDISRPPDAEQTQHPRLLQNEQEWTLEIEILNASTCDWPQGLLFFSFIDNAGSDLAEFAQGCTENRTFTDNNLTFPEIDNIRINDTVQQGESTVIELSGRTGDRFGCYFGTWELRIPEYELFVGDPLVIGYRVFGGR